MASLEELQAAVAAVNAAVNELTAAKANEAAAPDFQAEVDSLNAAAAELHSLLPAAAAPEPASEPDPTLADLQPPAA